MEQDHSDIVNVSPAVSCQPGEGEGAPRGTSGALSPSLSTSNKCNGLKDGGAGNLNVLTGQHRKVSYALTLNIQGLAKKYGLERLGFLTLTFADGKAYDYAGARACYRSLRTGVLSKRYQAVVSTIERSPSGRLHFHCVVVCPWDIRTGVDFKEIEDGKYTSAGIHLRSEWAFWRKTARSYGFGRTELLPVKSTADGIARYVGKYISKHIENRSQVDKGAHLASFVGKVEDRTAWCKLAWNNARARLFRAKLQSMAEQCGMSYEDFRERFGRRWAWKLQGTILGFKPHFYPDAETGYIDGMPWEAEASREKELRASKSWEASEHVLFTRKEVYEPMCPDPDWSIPPSFGDVLRELQEVQEERRLARKWKNPDFLDWLRAMAWQREFENNVIPKLQENMESSLRGEKPTWELTWGKRYDHQSCNQTSSNETTACRESIRL